MSDSILVAVCGAHMSELPLNYQLTDIGGKLIAKTSTAPKYQLFKIATFTPARPGLLRTTEGTSIALEVWEIPLASYGAFVAAIPGPLGIGSIELADGSQVQGFLCEHYATTDAENISHCGGWRAYLQQI